MLPGRNCCAAASNRTRDELPNPSKRKSVLLNIEGVASYWTLVNSGRRESDSDPIGL